MKGLVDFVKKNWIALTLVLVVVLAAGLGFKGCNAKQEKQWRDGIKYASAGAVEINEQVKAFCKAELLKPESCAKAQPQAEKIANIAKRIDTFAGEHPKLTPESKPEALALADDLLREVEALEADGVVDFKDTAKRKGFLIGVEIAKSAIRIAKAGIETQPAEEASPTTTPTPATSPSPSSSPAQ